VWGGITKESTETLKGVFAVMVLVSHLQSNTTIFNKIFIAPILVSFGYLGVAGFMFLSGYGLYCGYISKGLQYLDGFVRKKILPLYRIMIFLIFAYTIRDCLFQYEVSLRAFLQSFFWGETVIDKGWYLQVQLLFYFVFYLGFRFNKSRPIMTTGFIIGIYYMICHFTKTSSTWYETSFSFVVGMIVCAVKENRIRKKGMKFLAFCLFLLSYLAGNLSFVRYWLRIPIKSISAITFAIVVYFIANRMEKTNVRLHILQWLGKYSLEIYVVQGFFLKLFSKELKIENDFLYILLVVVFTLLGSMIAKVVFQKCASFGTKSD
jgi:peptidoglycan/LPS O-acetylase OafA/YrhL